jgi:pimeloyl-ACP methyl ester carboxylesterase
MKFPASLVCSLLAFYCAGASSQPDNPSLNDGVATHEAAASVEIIDRQAFMVESPVRNVVLSPDGNYVAWLASENHHTALHLLQLVSGQKSRLLSSTALGSIHWTSDSRHLILGLDTAVGVVDLANPDRPAYIAMLDAGKTESFPGSTQGVLDHVLITGRYDDGSYALRQIEINGESRELVRQDAMIVSAVAAEDGNSVIFDSVSSLGRQFALVSEAGQTLLFSCELLESCVVHSYQQDENKLWLSANAGSNLINLMSYRLDERNLEVSHTHPDGIVDLAGVVLVQNQPRVVQYHDGLLRNYGLDAMTDAQLQTIQALLPDSSFTPQISNDGSIWLVTERSSVLQHARYYLFVPATGSLTEILREERSNADAISPDALSRKIPFRYPSQDGSLLHGYVSLPKGGPLDDSAMVTLVHGGPLGRVDSGYSEFTQFLVNRGYIVFEPNFRASTGYGREYVEQAAREFGDGLVQQDIVDGAHYLIAQGIGDPEKLGIAGHSFGGSAVLAGLAFTPELFKAGFASAPPADMVPVMRFQNTPERTANQDPSVLALLELMFGSVDDAAAMQAMSARSPQAHLSQITAPLLLIA